MKLKFSFLEKFHFPKLLKVLALPLTLFGVALAVRIPWLWEIPWFIDELREVNLGYQISLGKTFPLHNIPKDVGAFHNYILAGIFALFGPNVAWPRLYVAITSAITVVLVYYLGKQLFNRWAGLIAAGLLLTNGMHILVTHMAWANCTTPFFFTLALMSTIQAEQKKNGKWLMLAGLFWALTLQTHSSVGIYLLVVAVYVLRPGFRITTGFGFADYVKATGVFILGYANMIIYNIFSGFGSIRWLFVKQYTLEQHPGLASFANNVAQMLIELIRSLSSTYASLNNSWGYLTRPEFLLALILFGAGVYWGVKWKAEPFGFKEPNGTGSRRLGSPARFENSSGVKNTRADGRLLVWMIAGGFLVIPWINHRYGFFIVTRYIMPVIICAILLVAAFLAGLLETLRRSSRKVFERRKVLIPGLAVLLIIMALQLMIFYQYCRNINGSDLSNHLNLEVLHRVQEISRDARNRRQKTVVWLDRSLTGNVAPLPILFSISRIEYRSLPKDAFSGQPSCVNASAEFLKQLQQDGSRTSARHNSGEKILAILPSQSYRRLKVLLPSVREQHFSRQSLLHFAPGRKKREVIYIAELQASVERK